MLALPVIVIPYVYLEQTSRYFRGKNNGKKNQPLYIFPTEWEKCGFIFRILRTKAFQ